MNVVAKKSTMVSVVKPAQPKRVVLTQKPGGKWAVEFDEGEPQMSFTPRDCNFLGRALRTQYRLYTRKFRLQSLRIADKLRKEEADASNTSRT